MRTQLLSGVLALALFGSCQHNSVGPEPPSTPREFTALEKRALSSGNTFSFKLFSAVNAGQQGENVFLSPLSVSIALGMTLNGAEGTTFDAMQQTLELSGMSREEINRSYHDILTILPALDPLVKFEIANSLWYRLGFEVQKAFIDDNATMFNAEVRPLDFGAPDAPNTINGWVSDKTHKKITKVLNAIPNDAVMYLINALYFKGTWTYQFAVNQTADGPFTRPDGSTVTCPLMRQKAEFQYGLVGDVQVIDLPYGNGTFSMTVLLPRAGADLDAFSASLTADRWSAFTGGLSKREVTLTLPRFKLAYGQRLVQTLAAMGMGIAFGGEANFSRINPTVSLAISDVLQKTFVEVNEEGTEAAAVTAVEISVTRTMPQETVMRVDRPFVFALREQSTGAILFLGKIVDPTAEQSGS